MISLYDAVQDFEKYDDSDDENPTSEDALVRALRHILSKSGVLLDDYTERKAAEVAERKRKREEYLASLPPEVRKRLENITTQDIFRFHTAALHLAYGKVQNSVNPLYAEIFNLQRAEE